jgi:alkanesulfonate monooxygenase SsuD/methylene tetrahydromethanopterin reductase-like flavin-dependent oxidoreductase (luciferase family)
MDPQLGVFLPTLTAAGDTSVDVIAAARHAEDLGFESVWVVDQLIAGTGVPILDSTVVLSAVAGATSRVGLAFGVAIAPLHPPVWLAKQVASLQQVSGGRVLLGIGAGGDRHARSWDAAGAPRRERGRRTDEALAVLPGLIAGEPVALPGSTHPVQLAPGAPVPPIVVGGMSDAAVRRAAEHGDDWFLFPVPPAEVAAARTRVDEAAAAVGRAAPTITASIMVALEGDPAVPAAEQIAAQVADPDGLFGMPPEVAATAVFQGSPADLAARLAELHQAGAHRVVVTIAAGDWLRQAELLAEASTLHAPVAATT